MEAKEKVPGNDLTSRCSVQELIDDKDLYISRYSIFSEEPHTLQEVLRNCDVVDWKQLLQIEG